jgi:glucose/arabinose dehydrogenase
MRRMLPVVAVLATATPASGDGGGILLPRFDDVPVIEGLTEPVSVRFAADGTIFVAEKPGRIKLFDPLPTPGNGTVVLDIRDRVMDFQDRGLLGLALHPQYPQVPFVYVLYTYDAPPGGVAPLWNDVCDAPNDIGGGCVVSGRLVRYTMASGVAGPVLVGERTLIQDDWYQQYPSHSIGDLAFGPDGMLYVSGGDGASYQFVDTGEPGQINQTHPSAGDPVHEGGALRAQDLLTSGDPLGLNGSVLRVDPDTGAAAAGNPLPGIRQIAFGLRNPFRFGFRPGTRELWIGDVGENSWEEINRITDVGDGVVENFGWPCYEGAGIHPGYADAPLCSALIHDGLPPGTPGTRTAPFFSYRHGDAPGAGLSPDGCQNGNGQAISGIAFYQGGTYPSQYQRALFFADYAVNCIYAMRADASGVPDPSQIDVVERAADVPVSLQVGPGGDIFYAAVTGAIRRITYQTDLTAKATASVTTGEAPLTVQFDGSGSVDPAGGPLDYAWDLDGDGAFDDATGPRAQWTYDRGVFAARLQVKGHGDTAVSAPIAITVGVRPLPAITAPANGALFKAGQRIEFAGAGSDPQDGALPVQAMSWRIVLLHCPAGGCHQHPFESFDGVAGGSFVAAPDGYPAYYDIALTVTDADNFTSTTTVRITAIGTQLQFDTDPSGLLLRYTGTPLATPAQLTEVAGDTVTLEAPLSEERGGIAYVFTGWSDGGDRMRVLTIPDGPERYVATYEVDSDRDGLPDSTDPCPTTADPSCTAAPPGRLTGGCSAGGSPGLAFALLFALAAAHRRRGRPRR